MSNNITTGKADFQRMEYYENKLKEYPVEARISTSKAKKYRPESFAGKFTDHYVAIPFPARGHTIYLFKNDIDKQIFLNITTPKRS